jgi:hypothetical protein
MSTSIKPMIGANQPLTYYTPLDIPRVLKVSPSLTRRPSLAP